MKSKIINNIFSKWWYPFIIIFFSIIYFLNFPLEFFVWWDASATFLNPSFYYNLYSWNDSSFLGGIANKTLYIWYIFYFSILDFFVNIFWYLWWSYIYNYIFHIFCILIFYNWLTFFVKNKKIAILLTIFFVFHFFIWWVVAHRGLIFISLVYFSPLFVAKNILIWARNYKNLFFLPIVWFLFLSVASNPGYFWPWLILVFSLIFWEKFLRKSDLNLKKIIISGFAFFLPFILPIASYLIFLKYNNAILQDDWNNKVLVENSLQSEKTTASLDKTLRLNQTFLTSYWGYEENGELSYSFPGYKIYQTAFFQFLSFLPLFMIIFAFIIIKNDGKNKKELLFWLLILLFAIFVMKSSAKPFWEIFIWAIQNIPGFSMFRSPGVKFWVVALYAVLIFFAIFLLSFKEENNKIFKIYFAWILVYSLFFGYYWFLGKAVPNIKLVKNIPLEYVQSSKYMNNLWIKKAFLLPTNVSTWTNTEFWYEWYSLFYILNPEIWIWNKNDGAFYSESNNVLNMISAWLKNKEKFEEFLEKYWVDAIIYDEYTDRYPRFHISETHEKTLDFLRDFFGNSWEKFWKIYIFTKTNFKPNALVYAKNTSLKYQKKSPVEYDISLENISEDELIFRQSKHSWWKIYPDLREYNFFEKIFVILRWKEVLEKIENENWTNNWKISENSPQKFTLYFYPQVFFYLAAIIFLIILIFYYFILLFFRLWKK